VDGELTAESESGFLQIDEIQVLAQP
jgi:hypothetical protein